MFPSIPLGPDPLPSTAMHSELGAEPNGVTGDAFESQMKRALGTKSRPLDSVARQSPARSSAQRPVTGSDSTEHVLNSTTSSQSSHSSDGCSGSNADDTAADSHPRPVKPKATETAVHQVGLAFMTSVPLVEVTPTVPTGQGTGARGSNSSVVSQAAPTDSPEKPVLESESKEQLKQPEAKGTVPSLQNQEQDPNERNQLIPQSPTPSEKFADKARSTDASDSSKNTEAVVEVPQNTSEVPSSASHPGLAGLPNAPGPPDKLAAQLPSGAAPPNSRQDVPDSPTPKMVGKDFLPPLGTSAAQQDMSMKKAEKTLKNAELTEQNLPGSNAVSAAQNPAHDVLGQVSSTNSSAEATALGTGSRLGSLEKTHDLITVHALRLTQSGTDSMRVVIEPGSGTRLSLELRFANGAVEAQAQLHRGDYNFLSHHWNELQQRLEPRGIHLGALQCSTNWSGDQRSSKQSANTDDDQSTRSAFADFAFKGTNNNTRTKGLVKSHQGWETWA